MDVFDPEVWAVVSQQPAFLGFVALLGALWGSFANVCIYRMPPSDEFPHGRSVVSPGSHCFECGHNVRWYDNIPLLSFLWLKGQCRDCGASFSARYLLVEGIMAMLFVAVFRYITGILDVGASPAEQLIHVGVITAFVWLLVVITFIDLDHHLILNKITYVAIPAFYGLGLLLPGGGWRKGLIGIAVGYGLIRGIADLFWLLTKREGMGYGDGKLLAIVGALFGWQGVIVALFLGSFVGTIIIVPLLLGRRLWAVYSNSESSTSEDDRDLGQPGSWRRIEIPFGPFIAIGAIIYVFVEADLRIRFFFLW